MEKFHENGNVPYAQKSSISMEKYQENRKVP